MISSVMSSLEFVDTKKKDNRTYRDCGTGSHLLLELSFSMCSQVCQTPSTDPKLAPRFVCGQCSGPHATKDHPTGDEELKCPVCSGAHLFHQCPTQIKACQASVRQQRRSYAEVVAKQRARPPQPKPRVRIPTTISELQNLQDNEQLRSLIQLIVEALLTGKLASLWQALQTRKHDSAPPNVLG